MTNTTKYMNVKSRESAITRGVMSKDNTSIAILDDNAIADESTIYSAKRTEELIGDLASSQTANLADKADSDQWTY